MTDIIDRLEEFANEYCLSSVIIDAKSEIKKLRLALAVYADPDNWIVHRDVETFIWNGDYPVCVASDPIKFAADALKGPNA